MSLIGRRWGGADVKREDGMKKNMLRSEQKEKGGQFFNRLMLGDVPIQEE